MPVDAINGNLLDTMLLLGKWGLHRVCVVNSNTHDIDNVLTQSNIIAFLHE